MITSRRPFAYLSICVCAALGVSAAAVVSAVSASASTVSATLAAGHELVAGQSIVSSGGQYRAVMQHDGNFVEYGPGGHVIWSPLIQNRGGIRLAMQHDGNVVVYGPGGHAVYSSKTAPSSNDHLVMQRDGNLVIYNGAGKALWVNGHRISQPVSSTLGTKIIAVARSYLGTAYGGQFDCSGYTQLVYRQAGIANLVHNSEAQREQMRIIPGSQARPGDLIFYMSGGSAYHVAIFAGGGMQYAANVPGGGVVYQGIWSNDIEFGTDWH